MVSQGRPGQALNFYDGEALQGNAHWATLTGAQGRYHTLQVGRGLHSRLVNGIHGRTGAQYMNTDRRGRGVNAEFTEGVTGTVRLRGSAGALGPGKQILVDYRWDAAHWREQESQVVGMLCWEPGEVAFIEELFTLDRGKGIATNLIKALRLQRDSRLLGDVELQVHPSNAGARRLYEKLGWTKWRWWEGEELREAGAAEGETPERGQEVWRVTGPTLDMLLDEHTERHGEAWPEGMHVIVAQSLGQLKALGLVAELKWAARHVYNAQEWRAAGERPDCLYNVALGAVCRYLVVTRGPPPQAVPAHIAAPGTEAGGSTRKRSIHMVDGGDSVPLLASVLKAVRITPPHDTSSPRQDLEGRDSTQHAQNGEQLVGDSPPRAAERHDRQERAQSITYIWAPLGQFGTSGRLHVRQGRRLREHAEHPDAREGAGSSSLIHLSTSDALYDRDDGRSTSHIHRSADSGDTKGRKRERTDRAETDRARHRKRQKCLGGVHIEVDSTTEPGVT